MFLDDNINVLYFEHLYNKDKNALKRCLQHVLNSMYINSKMNRALQKSKFLIYVMESIDPSIIIENTKLMKLFLDFIKSPIEDVQIEHSDAYIEYVYPENKKNNVNQIRYAFRDILEMNRSKAIFNAIEKITLDEFILYTVYGNSTTRLSFKNEALHKMMLEYDFDIEKLTKTSAKRFILNMMLSCEYNKYNIDLLRNNNVFKHYFKTSKEVSRSVRTSFLDIYGPMKHITDDYLEKIRNEFFYMLYEDSDMSSSILRQWLAYELKRGSFDIFKFIVEDRKKKLKNKYDVGLMKVILNSFKSTELDKSERYLQIVLEGDTHE
jgi:hypothetical protein